MSDPQVPQSEQANDVDDVLESANAGLDAAAAAAAEVPADGETVVVEEITVEERVAEVDPDLAAFAEAEAAFPGTFGAGDQDAEHESALPEPLFAEPNDDAVTAAFAASDDEDATVVAAEQEETPEAATTVFPAAGDGTGDDAPTTVLASSDDSDQAATTVLPESPLAAEPVVAAYAPPPPAATTVLPAEPVVTTPQPQPQPIFVQAPEPPRELGNRGTAGAIGLVATLCFALLYLGATLGLGALAGTVTTENIAQSALAPLSTWSFWVPVVVFFLAFWLLGALINRGRWGHWVIFGLFVAAASYGGHLLGQLFQAPFWLISPSQASELVGEQLFAPLAIAAFVIARELTVWFGAWVARRGARKTELNAEAQREYERTLEAGPSLAR